MANAIILAIVVVAAVGIAYRQVIQNGFFLADDHALILAASTPGSWSLFVHDPWFSTGIRHPEFWRPLGSLAWKLNYDATGPNPMGFYQWNLGLHLINAGLVALLALRLRRGKVVAYTAAALFAVHPMATETVSWLAARFDLVAVAFSIVSLCCFVKSLRCAPGAQWWATGAVVSFALALLAKESAVVVPLLAVLFSVSTQDEQLKVLLQARRLIRAVWPTTPLWATVVVYLVLRTAQLGTVGAYTGYLTTGVSEIPENLLYHSRMIFFVPFDVDAYVAPNAYTRPDLATLAMVVPLVLVAMTTVFLPPVRFGLAWILIALLPVLTINGGGRIVYLALVGYALFLGEVAGVTVSKIMVRANNVNTGRRLWQSVAGLELVLFAGLTCALLTSYTLTARDRNRIWSDAGELMQLVPQQAVTLYPGLPAGAIVYVRGLPDQWREVYVFRNVSAVPFDVDGTEHRPNLTYQAWQQASFGRIVSVSSFPSTVPPKDVCRTFFAQYENDTLTWQPVPIPPSTACRPVEETSVPGEFTTTHYTFGNFAQLRSFRLSSVTVQAGSQLQVDLVWKVLSQPPGNYKTFIHIAKGDVPPVAQRDSEPYGGRYPTSTWIPGIELRDSNRITIPANLSPGTYEVTAGMYSTSTAQRVSVSQSDAAIGDHIVLAVIHVVALTQP